MKRILLGLTTLLLAGCVFPSGTQDPLGGQTGTGNPGAGTGNVATQGNAVLELVTEVRDGSYTTLAEVKNYTRTDIKRLDVELIRLEKDGNGWKLPATLNAENRSVNSTDLSGSGTIRFTGLRPKTTYRIRWAAFDVATPAPGAVPISVPGELDVPIDIEEVVNVAKLMVRLKDRPFNATATAEGIDVTDGGYTYSGSETIEFVPSN